MARLLLLAFFLANLTRATKAQCVPKPYSGKQEVFSSVVQNVKGPGVSVGPAGIELSLDERAKRVLATLRDYKGRSSALETKLEGTLRESYWLRRFFVRPQQTRKGGNPRYHHCRQLPRDH